MERDKNSFRSRLPQIIAGVLSVKSSEYAAPIMPSAGKPVAFL